jgi:molybdopterin-guanine dinucleotide biosynthesis protein A
VADRTPPAAAILAGGRARRFGGIHKGTLRIGGQRIIERLIAVLRHVADPVFIVAAEREPYVDLGLEIVPDVVAGRGALGGIYTGIVRSPRDRVVIVACDMPFLSERLLVRMTASSDADIVIPRTERGYEPLCALYSKACAEPIRGRLERGLLQASRLPEELRVEEIGPEILATYDPDGLLFVNVNTPHDYERALGLFESMGQPSQDRITERLPPERR